MLTVGLGGAGLVANFFLTLVTPHTIAQQPSLSMGLPREEHWSGLPLTDPAIKPRPPGFFFYLTN